MEIGMARWSDRRKGRIGAVRLVQIWLMMRVLPTLALLLSRHRERLSLATLDDRQLRDIGLTRDEALIEAGRPFWR